MLGSSFSRKEIEVKTPSVLVDRYILRFRPVQFKNGQSIKALIMGYVFCVTKNISPLQCFDKMLMFTKHIYEFWVVHLHIASIF